MSYAYTLTAVTLREPVGLRENTKEDSAMEARRNITIVEIVAETLLTLAYTLCIVEGEAVRTRRSLPQNPGPTPASLLQTQKRKTTPALN